jgi:hypothetical protein
MFVRSLKRRDLGYGMPGKHVLKGYPRFLSYSKNRGGSLWRRAEFECPRTTI